MPGQLVERLVDVLAERVDDGDDSTDLDDLVELAVAEGGCGQDGDGYEECSAVLHGAIVAHK